MEYVFAVFWKLLGHVVKIYWLRMALTVASEFSWKDLLSFRVSSQSLLGNPILPAERVTVIWEDLSKLKIGSMKMGCGAVGLHGYTFVWETTSSTRLWPNSYRFWQREQIFYQAVLMQRDPNNFEACSTYCTVACGIVIQWLKQVRKWVYKRLFGCIQK